MLLVVSVVNTICGQEDWNFTFVTIQYSLYSFRVTDAYQKKKANLL